MPVTCPEIVWRSPPRRLDERDARGEDAPTKAPLQRTLAAIFKVGIPSVAHAATPKEDAIGLLRLAAEVEHALMVSYLFAAQSLRGTPADVVRRIAVQEMGHLMTIQNLLLCLCGLTSEQRPAVIHLGRDRLRRASERNPLPLRLEPVSRDVLARFSVVERPHFIDDPLLAARIDRLEREVEAGGVSVNPIYALYAAIRWIFQASDDPDELGLSPSHGLKPGWHLEDSDFVDPRLIEPFITTAAEWNGVPGLIVEPVRGRADGLFAIDRITAQGEGLPGAPSSHFSAFVELLDRFESGSIGVKPLPRSPTISDPSLHEDPVPTVIANSYARAWAKLLEQAYELLLLDLAWAISQPLGATRRALIRLSIATMTEVVDDLSNHLTRLPIGADPEVRAGPTFAIPDQSIPTDMAGFRRRYAAALDRQAEALVAVREAPEFADDAFGEAYVAAVERIAAARSPHQP